MKKKIIIISSIFSLISISCGIYVIITIANATSTLDNLITLHQVEILREHLLMQIKKVQMDLSLRNTRHDRGIDTLVSDMKNVQNVASACLTCHHKPDVFRRLNDLQHQIDSYREAVSRVTTMGASEQRLRVEYDSAFTMGEEMLAKVNNVIAITRGNLAEKTAANLWKIKNIKLVLFILVAAGPLAAMGFAFILTRSFTKPITILLEATRKIKEGALDYKVGGLKHEFGEVADSFNDMAIALKKHMLKIEESEKQYRMLFESAGDAIFILETEGADAGRIIAANRAAAEMHGYTVDELLTLSMRELDIPEAAEKVSSLISHILNGEWYKAEINHIRKDGTIFPVDISAGLLNLGSNKKYALVFGRDISERKRAEKMLHRTEQLKMCGELAAGLAHEIKNPLSGIKASMELLFKDLKVGEPDKQILLKAIEDTIRIESFMKGLLSFARPPEPQFTMVDVNSVIDWTVAFSLKHPSFSSDGKVITIKKDLFEYMPEITADPLKLQQVFLNLLLNAADAMPEGGTITLKTFYDVPSNSILITVCDTGIGFGEQVMNKIFEPFFTTKSKGTGMGMAIVKRLVEQHGGNIAVESAPGKGTTFNINIPVSQIEGGKTV